MIDLSNIRKINEKHVGAKLQTSHNGCEVTNFAQRVKLVDD